MLDSLVGGCGVVRRDYGDWSGIDGVRIILVGHNTRAYA